MNEEEYRRMRAVEDGNWWFAGKRALVESLLCQALGKACGGRILDVGCGTGATLQMLARFGQPVGTDRSLAALRLCAERGAGALCASDAERLPFADGSFVAVTALDVLEHLDDPVLALREMARVCAPRGVVIVSVPAHPVLWSGHDVALAHRRRYSAGLLRRQMAAAGLSVERLTYAYAAAFLPALVIRRLARWRHGQPRADLGMVAGPINAVLTAYVRLEAALLRSVSLPIGTSLLGVARR